MGQSPRARAEEEQRKASDPTVSTFVAASAGSGKTKLLTDRLLRLMLGGADPARIQCLTFTRAAAAEMDLRLRSVLSRWVTSEDAALDEELKKLQFAPDAGLREAARGLFARVLDLPGGMRIGTIHAFCQALLRRFPLEAGISPHFQVIEDADATASLATAREAALAEAHSERMRAALALVAPLARTEDFSAVVARLRGAGERFVRASAAPKDAQARALGLATAREADLLRAAVSWPAEPDLQATVAAILAHPSTANGIRNRAERMARWLERDVPARVAGWEDWVACFRTQAGAPRAPSTLVNETVHKLRPELRKTLVAEQQRVTSIADECQACRLAALSAALLVLAVPVARGYEARKGAGGLLDYDDLIAHTSAVLHDPGVAWVLYKLDGGLDHLLLDEVQDTAPAQWRIAGALTEEFFAGQGATTAERTVFAVGDRKQSIYSFQGADPDEFDRWRAIMRQRVMDARRSWRDVALDVSFRSTRPVLSLVDAVFADPLAAAGVVEPGSALRHFAERAGHAGCVELWPLAPKPARADLPPWDVPRNYPSAETSAPQRLAEALATWIAQQTGGGVALPSRGRDLAAGDVLVLVRRRNSFARALVRSLKARGVPVAGLDRLLLPEQPAVADLLTLCDVLLLPDDDLALAAVLTSPLGGLADEDLIALAPERNGTLWDQLRRRASERPVWAKAATFLATLFGRVDYASPHALLAEALGPLGGRARLLARLGPEAAEPVDELLNAALRFAQMHPAALQSFVHWVRRSAAEVKREPEGAGHAVRVMTAHGAKGLQAPLVILPDTTALPPERDELLWCTDPETGAEVPLWVPRKDFRCTAADKLRHNAQAKRMAEHNRLLYVALTRAEDRLVVCGWEPRSAPHEACWYSAVRRGFTALRADPAGLLPEALPADAAGLPWPDEVLRFASPQQIAPDIGRRVDAAPAAALPGWAGAAPAWQAAPPPPEPALPEPLAPSRPEGATLGPVPHVVSPLTDRAASVQRMRRGQLIHELLQHLPDRPAAAWRDAARAFLGRPGSGLDPEAAPALAEEVLNVLHHPDLAPLFGAGSRAEVPLTGVVGGVVIGGLVDRLVVLPDAVLIADYKSNRDPPRDPADTPVLYLRQMAAYRAVLRAVYPDRPVRCALVWTRAARVSLLPPALLDRHAPGAALPAV